MVVEFTFPDVGEGVTEGTLLKWLVEVGDSVEEDESLAEVETDKAVVEVPSPTDGTITELRAEEGALINVGDVIVVIDDEGGAAEAPAQDGSGEDEADMDTEADESAEATAEAEPEESEPAVDEEMAELVADHTVDEVKHRVERDDLDPVAVLAAEQDGQERKTLISWLEDRVAAEDVPESTAIVGTLSEDEQPEAADREETESREADRQEEAVEPSGDVLAVPAARKLALDEDVDLASVTGSGPDGAVTVSDVKAAIAGGTGAADTGAEEAAAPEAGGKVLAAPSTRRLAREKDVDITTLEGGGPGGRVTKADVEAAAGAEPEAAAEPEAGGDAAGEPAETREPVAEARQPGALGETFGSSGRRFEPKTYDFAQWGEVEREELSGTRRAIARQMERSKYTAPHVTSMDEADVTDLWELRAKEKGVAEQKGVHLTFMPFIMKAVISALKDYPLLNASLDETTGEVVKKHYHNIGVAVATDDGLLVPTIKDADDKSILELARDINTLAEKARDRELSLEEMKGGTFTITNWGSIGGSYGTPILNYPEVGILGTGVIEEKPVVVDGEVTVRKVLPLSLTFDHRVVDGAYAAQFLNELVTHLEDPDLLLIDE